jgi:hypothetical protein
VSDAPTRVVLLGPQRDRPDAGAVVAGLGEPGPVALITAGWQEWEEDDGALRCALGREGFNLRLWARAERVWREDPELAAGHRALQQDVRLLRRAYNLRLARAMDAWIDMEALGGDPGVLSADRDDALEVVRALDRHHAGRLRELRDAFYRRYDPQWRAAVVRERDEIRRALDPARVVVVEGGHVPALLNRLRLFGVDGLLGGKTVVACSGGAMALAERVVLFHDFPPWGPGHAEVGEVGVGLLPGVVALANGSARLRLDDAGRVARFARRFEPDVCVLLDAGTRVEWAGGWSARDARVLGVSGRVEPWRTAA